MKRWPLLLLLVIAFSIGVGLAFATNFTSTAVPNTADAGLTNKFLNFSVTNTGPANITIVNVTFPTGFTFVLDSNGTNSTNAVFFNKSSTEIGWGNLTPAGIVNVTAYFWFNVSIPKNIYGTYNFNVSTNDSSSNYNSTNVSVYIERTVWSSPLEQFYIKPAEIYLNYTNSYSNNISIILNSTSSSWEGITVELLNDTGTYPDSSLLRNYSQDYPNTICDNRLLLQIKNTTTQYGTFVGPLNSTSVLNATLVHIRTECYSGRYRTVKFTIRNSTRYNETANITVILDIPISIANTLSNATRIGTFNGQIPANTSAYYHSFFFNATSAITGEIANATGITINLNSTPADVDIFLFDSSGNLITKSINKTGNESLTYSYLPTSSNMWEIRVYGNYTSAITYNGNIIFTTLNITNSTNHMITQIDFGTVNATNNKTTEIRLTNQGNLSLSNVAESKELYYMKRFIGTSPNNFTFFVPDSSITTRVKVSLNWTGASNYSFNLYNQSDIVVASSAAKNNYANITGAVQEEYDETTIIGPSSKLWRVEVKNATNATGPYNLTVYLYVNATDWISTNYTTQTLNRTGGTGSDNYTFDVQVNLTVPASKAMNGTYEGYIQYLDNRKSGIKLPVRFEVTTPMLLVNNSMNSETFRVDEDYGFNLTRILYFNITNPGLYSLDINLTDSGNLSCYSGSCTGYNASFAYNSTAFSIPDNSFTILNVNITFNRSLPKNTVYSGWIKLNTTGFSNTTANLTSHPYTSYTINLQLNMTDLLTMGIEFMSADWSDKVVYNSTHTFAENITIRTDIYFINGSGPLGNVLAGLSNFSAVWLQERNVTGTDGMINLTFYNGTSPIYCTAGCPFGSNYYYINATVPANKPGGLYNVYVSMNYTANYSAPALTTYSGQISNGTLIINNTGLHMSTNTTGCSFGSSCSPSISISNTSTYRFFVNVSNYGPIAASSNYIAFSNPCTGYSIAYTDYSGSCTVSGAANSTLTTVPAQNTNCTIWYTITAGTSAASACTASLIGSPVSKWFNPYGVNASITVTASSGGTTTPPGDSGSVVPGVNYSTTLQFTKAESLVIVQQKSTNSTTVVVKNAGNKTQTVNFTIETLNASWYSINSTSASIAMNNEVAFKITFAVDKVTVKDYSGKYKANSTYRTITSDFSLRVTPASEEQVTINATLALYKLNMTRLSEEISEAKTTGVNVTATETKFAELKAKIEQAESYISNGDYFSAYQLFDQIETLTRAVESELDKAKNEFIERTRFPWMMVAIAIVVIAVGGILVYLFWPTKEGYTPQKKQYAFKPPKEESKTEDAWSQLKEKWSKGESVQKYKYAGKESLFDKIKNIFKRK